MTKTEIAKRILFFDVFPFLCRLIASILFLIALHGIGFPPKKEIGTTQLSLLIFSTFFLILPLAKKISVGKLLTFEKEVKDVKKDVSDFKAETREFLTVYSNMITAISNTVSQTVTVNLPGKEEVEEAKKELESAIEHEAEGAPSPEEEIENYILRSGNDINYALAHLRMDLEHTLRRILGTLGMGDDVFGKPRAFISTRQLFRKLLDHYPQYRAMQSSYDYILKICNAAIHGQKVSDHHGHEALYMGIKMLNELKQVTPHRDTPHTDTHI